MAMDGKDRVVRTVAEVNEAGGHTEVGQGKRAGQSATKVAESVLEDEIGIDADLCKT